MPKPNKGEKQKDFIARCMASPESQKSFPKHAQRAAVCYDTWRRAHRGKKRKAGATN